MQTHEHSKTMSNKQWKCGRCGKRHHTRVSTIQHISSMHGGVGEPELVKPRDDEELSIAQRAMAAQLDKAMGLPVDDELDWINDL